MFGASDFLGWRYALGPLLVSILAAAAVVGLTHFLSLKLGMMLAIAPIAAFMMLQNTFLLAVIFICFAYFRIHEAYPALMPLGLIGPLGAAVVGGLMWRGFLLDGNAPKGQRELKVLSLVMAGVAIVFSALVGGAESFAGASGLAFGVVGLVAFACALALWHQLLGRSSPDGWPPTMNYFVIFAMLSSIGVALSPYPVSAYSHWVTVYWKICLIVFAIAWLAREEKDFGQSLYLILLTGVAIAAVAIYNKLNGIDLVEDTRVAIGLNLTAPKGAILPPDESGKYGSALGDPNELSMVLLFPLSFAGALIYYRPNRILVLLSIVAVCCLLLAIIYTQSRGGLLAVLAVGGIIGLRAVKSKTLLIAGGAVAALGLFIAMGLSERAVVDDSGAIDNSSMGRVWAWGAALIMLVRYPLTGVGMTTFQDAHVDYHIMLTGFNKEVHSTWFGVLAETGFPGFVVFMLMVFYAAKTSWEAMRRLDEMDADPRMRAMALALVAGIGGFCVAGSFLTHGFTWPLYIQVAFSVALWRFVKQKERAISEVQTGPSRTAWNAEKRHAIERPPAPNVA